ncbi:hypothetical protein M0802_011409 [Mischocyttarus mexicanus]|nr:hypothetical protein M0802_011409 [Mischocyttarus mexicanus]
MRERERDRKGDFQSANSKIPSGLERDDDDDDNDQEEDDDDGNEAVRKDFRAKGLEIPLFPQKSFIVYGLLRIWFIIID